MMTHIVSQSPPNQTRTLHACASMECTFLLALILFQFFPPHCSFSHFPTDSFCPSLLCYRRLENVRRIFVVFHRYPVLCATRSPIYIAARLSPPHEFLNPLVYHSSDLKRRHISTPIKIRPSLLTSRT